MVCEDDSCSAIFRHKNPRHSERGTADPRGLAKRFAASPPCSGPRTFQNDEGCEAMLPDAFLYVVTTLSVQIGMTEIS